MKKLRALEIDKRSQALQFAFFVLFIFGITYLIYWQYGVMLGRTTTDFRYWDDLARAFLHGKLYLDNPPITFDLTPYQGHWYVAPPPLPALLMLPVVFLTGGVNQILFSIFFSALNCALIYLILDRTARLGWIKASQGGLLWLVLLFAFGTPHWWLGMDGREWFVSQILTVTFTALATYCALRAWSPWWVGLCLALAVAARPNVALVWPFLFGIALQLMKEQAGRLETKRWLAWAVQSAVPVALAGAGLLFYNYLRFHNFLDFGFLTINGSERVVHDAQTYGMFNPIFIPRNLYMMFLQPPVFVNELPYILPIPEGMSLLLTTPALLFLIHKYERRLWVAGAWTSVILSVLALAMYHNFGAFQFGFRYLLDFIMPVMLLLATALKPRTSRLFIVLVVLSILINEYGAWWFIRYFRG